MGWAVSLGRLFTRRQLGLSIAIGLSGFAAYVAMAKGEQKADQLFKSMFRGDFSKKKSILRSKYNTERVTQWFKRKKNVSKFCVSLAILLPSSMDLNGVASGRESRWQPSWSGRAYVPSSRSCGKGSSLPMYWPGRVSQVKRVNHWRKRRSRWSYEYIYIYIMYTI